MPKTKLGAEVQRKKAEEMLRNQNHLADLFRYAIKAQGLTFEGAGKLVNISGPAMFHRINRSPDFWSVKEIKQTCEALGVPYEAALDALRRCA